MFGEPLRHQTSNASQEAYVLGASNEPLRLNGRHQRWSDNPLLDDRFASTPMVADQLGADQHKAGTQQSLHFSPFSRADSNRAVFDALPRMDSVQLHQLGYSRMRSGLVLQGSGLSRQGSGLSHQGSGLQYLQETMLGADDSACGDSVVMHGTNSLLEQQPQGKQDK